MFYSYASIDACVKTKLIHHDFLILLRFFYYKASFCLNQLLLP